MDSITIINTLFLVSVYTSFVLVYILGIYGFYKFDKDKLFWDNFLIYRYVLILPFFDIISTILFTAKFGIESEGNAIGRYLFSTFNTYGFVLMFFFAVFTLIVLYGANHLITYHRYYRENESIGFKRYSCDSLFFLMFMIISLYLIVLILNISVLFI